MYTTQGHKQVEDFNRAQALLFVTKVPSLRNLDSSSMSEHVRTSPLFHP
jgi:hypothetical protein